MNLVGSIKNFVSMEIFYAFAYVLYNFALVMSYLSFDVWNKESDSL